MPTHAYSFGPDNLHPLTGKSLGRRYVTITADTAERCRLEMLRWFGRAWSTEYFDAATLTTRNRIDPVKGLLLAITEGDPLPDSWPDQTPDGVAAAPAITQQPEPNAIMIVRVRDRSLEGPWGVGPIDPVVRRVVISAYCPRCGARRAEPRNLNQCDDGAHYSVDVWDNQCGHTDMYEDVVKEATDLVEPGFRWNQHNNERGHWCRCSGMQVSAQRAARDDQRCLHGCPDSRIEAVPGTCQWEDTFLSEGTIPCDIEQEPGSRYCRAHTRKARRLAQWDADVAAAERERSEPTDADYLNWNEANDHADEAAADE
jgi:hypothetical protein